MHRHLHARHPEFHFRGRGDHCIPIATTPVTVIFRGRQSASLARGKFS
jgi:hypothetical protein